MPDFSYEDLLWKQGYVNISGVDEVGRGALAGPVVCAAVIYNQIINIKKIAVEIDDSKKLSQIKRETASKWIKENAKGWGVGMASVYEINSLGIVKATNRATRRALNSAYKQSSVRADYLLSDAYYIPYIGGLPSPSKYTKKVISCGKYVFGKHRQLAIIKGDQKSISIASASILAKIERDKLMEDFHQIYPKYNWKSNKGYGTSEHRFSIKKFGQSKYHRKLFLRKIFSPI